MKQKGSITIFVALSLVLIMSFLLALFESGRMYALKTYADMTTELAIDSVCAEYQPGLWENYRLLCLDGAYGGETFLVEHVDGVLRSRIEQNLDSRDMRGNLLALGLREIENKSYQLLTDQNGDVFLHCIAASMKESLPMEVAESIYESYRQGEGMKDASVEESIETAQNAIIEAKKKRQEELAKDQVEDRTEEVQEEQRQAQESEAGESNKRENPLEIALALKQTAILGLVLRDEDTVSTKGIELSDGLTSRACRKGNMEDGGNAGWYEKILTLEYLTRYYGDFVKQEESHALSYEKEYVLCGEKTDRGNLEKAVERLLLLREAANITHILKDSEKRNETYLLAGSLAGFTGNPAIIKVVQIGIIGAWAYLESIQDVRTLLRGEKIALIKDKEQWTLRLDNIPESFQTSFGAKSCENGLSYPEYLKMLLFIGESSKLAYRMMEIMEQNLHLVPAWRQCRMDHMICKIDYAIEYEAGTVFMPERYLTCQVEKQCFYYE